MLSENQLIAPCGMNCGLCRAYLRGKRQCPGCHGDDARKMPSCVGCSIKNCEQLTQAGSGFCYECSRFPCRRLKQLDKRYRTKYMMSMIENLIHIKTFGLAAFTANEKIRWLCLNCGGMICVHTGYCLNCGPKST